MFIKVSVLKPNSITRVPEDNGVRYLNVDKIIEMDPVVFNGMVLTDIYYDMVTDYNRIRVKESIEEILNYIAWVK